MATIPDYTALGERPTPRPGAPQIQDRTGEIYAAGVQDIGQGLTSLGNDIYAHQTNMARAKAANALLDHEIAVKTTAEDIQQKVTTGELPFDQAEKVYADRVAKIPTPVIEHLDSVGEENLQRGVTRNIFTTGVQINHVVDVARRQDFQDQFTANLDKLGKLAGMPGANIDQINGQADAFRPLARAAGLPPQIVDKALQNFKDQNWLNHATQRSMEAKDNWQALSALEKDLTAKNGYYAGKLDTDKRNVVLRSVINDKLVLENRAEHLQDRREAKGQAALYQMERQISTGVPTPAPLLSQWASTVKGTSAEAEFQDQLKAEGTIQDVLRQPIEKQKSYLQAEQSKMDQGGASIREQMNHARLKAAIDQNVKTLQQEPLQFLSNRTGEDFAPLPLDKLVQGGDPATNKAMQQRVEAIDGLRKKYGDQVQMHLLKPQEASQLASVVANSTEKQAADVFGGLAASLGNDRAFRGVMQQIAPDAPVEALAGAIGAKQTQLTLEHNWFTADVVTGSKDVAATLIAGQRILHPTKESKKEDGSPATKLFLPQTTDLQQAFTNHVGKAFANFPDAAEQAFQAAAAYYVGKASQTGRLSQGTTDVNAKLVQEAITATTGAVVDFNGQGEVVAPWGMDETHFENAATIALVKQQDNIHWPARPGTALTQMGLRMAGPNQYYVTLGRATIKDKGGRPVLLNLGHQQ